MAENEKLAFEVTDMATGHKYEIFASGETRGFDHLQGCAIVNRIPALIAEAREEAAEEERAVRETCHECRGDYR